MAEDRRVDLVEEQFDVAIRINPSPDSELVQWGTVSGVEPELWVLHTSRRLAAPKMRAFVDFICTRYPDKSLLLKD